MFSDSFMYLVQGDQGACCRGSAQPNTTGRHVHEGWRCSGL